MGTGYSNIQLEYERDDTGLGEKISLAEFLVRLISFTIKRIFHVHNTLFPSMIGHAYMPSDRRYLRNVQRFRT